MLAWYYYISQRKDGLINWLHLPCPLLLLSCPLDMLKSFPSLDWGQYTWAVVIFRNQSRDGWLLDWGLIWLLWQLNPMSTFRKCSSSGIWTNLEHKYAHCMSISQLISFQQQHFSFSVSHLFCYIKSGIFVSGTSFFGHYFVIWSWFDFKHFLTLQLVPFSQSYFY